MADLASAMRAADALQVVRLNGPSLGVHASALEESAVIAAIVCYARPFVASNSGNLADRLVSPADLRMFDGDDHLARLHAEILKHRNEAVAHSDWSRRSTVFGSTGFENYWQVKEVEISNLIPDVDAFMGLITHAQDAVMRKMVPLLLLISSPPAAR